MGSYLEINEMETNSKAYSHILIEAIRYINKELLDREDYTKKQKNIIKFEKYTDDNIGLGNFIIKKKGIALAILRLQYLKEVDEEIDNLVKEDYTYYIEKTTTEINECEDKKEKAKKKREFEKRLKELHTIKVAEIDFCVKYLTQILIDMTLQNEKTVNGRWV